MTSDRPTQLELFTGLGRPWSPENEARDLRIMILDNFARQWYGKLLQIEVKCHCGAKLYFFWNYLSAYKGRGYLILTKQINSLVI